ncbi:MAG: S8 family serine peptidase [Oscillatoriales cyanobacterium RM2_1_1]|nr:S8 family serine peptidase [Oscillatoriales cyanobacterium SM2_3_0]NJO46598.1 S8 family serine peptidase [Oscillatoriales cyanobacterium RM2_1_1]
MSTPPTISPAFEQYFAKANANTHKDAVVLFRGAPPAALPPKGTQAYFDTINSQTQNNRAVVAEMAAGYRSETGEALNVEPVGSGAIPAAKVEVTPETLPVLAAQPNVVAILPNQKIHLIRPQAVDYAELNTQEANAKYTWGLQTMEIPKVWETTRGKDITVAVLDTGVYADHQALQGRVKGFVVIDPQGRRITATPAFDGGEHGTHVCGTIAGGTTETGVAIGVAPEAQLLAAGVLIGDSTLRTLIEGMSWAIEQGANIINMSLGMSYYEPLFAQVFDTLISQYNILPVIAIGNENHGNTSSPGSAYNAFSIGALEQQPNSKLDIAFFSSGASLVFPGSTTNQLVTKPDVVAPGAQVYSAIPPTQQPDGPHQYTYMDGTSMATPHVAGVAALLMSAKPDAPVSQIIEVLKETAFHPGGEEMRPDNRWGWGLIQPVKALEALLK